MATNDLQSFLPLLQQPAPVPVTPTAAPVPTAAANPALRRALIEPNPATPAAPVTADSLRAALAALQPYAAQLQPTPTAANAAPAAAVSTPPQVAQTDVTPPAAAPATVATPTNPATAPRQPLRAGTPRVGQDATAPVTVGSLPSFAAGTPDLSQAPNSVSYNDAGQPVSSRNGQGVEVIRNGVSTMVGGGGGTIGGRFVNPSDAIATGYAQQLAYQQASLSNLLDAFRNSDGLAATKHALATAVGLNNFGSVQGQGINTVNSALGNIAAAGAGANASMYGSTLGYLGHLATVGEQHYEAATGSVPVGTTLQTDPVTHLGVPVTVYGQRPGNIGQMPKLYEETQNARQPKPQPGKIYVDKAGNRATYNADGTYTPVK